MTINRQRATIGREVRTRVVKKTVGALELSAVVVGGEIMQQCRPTAVLAHLVDEQP